MKEIVEYTIFCSYYQSLLVEAVVEEIKNGWQPFGSLVIQVAPSETIPGKTNVIHYQPMVKYKKTVRKVIKED